MFQNRVVSCSDLSFISPGASGVSTANNFLISGLSSGFLTRFLFSQHVLVASSVLAYRMDNTPVAGVLSIDLVAIHRLIIPKLLFCA